MLRPSRHIVLPIIPPFPTYHRAHHPSLPVMLLYLLYYTTCQASCALFRPASYPTILVISECQTHSPACHTALPDISHFLFHHCPLYHTICHSSIPVTPLRLWYFLYHRSAIPVISLCSSYLFAHHAPPAYYSVQPVIPHCPTYHPSCCATLSVMPSCQ